MTRPGHETNPIPASGQQMDRSNDPETTRALDEAAPATALKSDRQRLTGSATGVGSVGFDDPGAFDVGTDGREHEDAPITEATKP